jgi:hypothetical protein
VIQVIERAMANSIESAQTLLPVALCDMCESMVAIGLGSSMQDDPRLPLLSVLGLL